MPIPSLNSHGLLPSGVFDCTLGEIDAIFAWNSHRKGLLKDFEACWTGEIRANFSEPLYFNGSFVTDKEQPDDIDVVLDLCQASDATKWQGLVFMQQHQTRLESQYRVHCWINLPGTKDFSGFFQYVGIKTAKFKGLDPKFHKGILRLV